MNKDVLGQVLAALKDARDHLDYCGYGDSWERECAQARGLEQQIAQAIEAGEKALEPPGPTESLAFDYANALVTKRLKGENDEA